MGPPQELPEDDPDDLSDIPEVEDFALEQAGVGPRNAIKLKIAKIVNALIAPNEPVTISNLAKKCRFSEHMTARLLAEPEFQQRIRDELHLRCMGTITQGLEDMRTITADRETKPGDRIRAFQASLTAFETLSAAIPEVEKEESRNKLQDQLNRLGQVQKVTITPEVKTNGASTVRPHHLPPAGGP